MLLLLACSRSALNLPTEAVGPLDVEVEAGEIVLRVDPNAEYACDTAVWADVRVE